MPVRYRTKLNPRLLFDPAQSDGLGPVARSRWLIPGPAKRDPLSYRLIIEDDEQRVAADDLEMTDLERATTEALLGFREILADHIRNGRAFTIKAIHIADQLGGILATVTLGEALSGILALDRPGGEPL